MWMFGTISPYPHPIPLISLNQFKLTPVVSPALISGLPLGPSAAHGNARLDSLVPRAASADAAGAVACPGPGRGGGGGGGGRHSEPRAHRRCGTASLRKLPSQQPPAGTASERPTVPSPAADTHCRHRQLRQQQVQRHRRHLAPDHQQQHNKQQERQQQQEQQQQQLAQPSAVGGRHGNNLSPPAAQSSFVVRSIQTWAGALQFLDVAGGPEGRPAPQLQLELLLQSRLFKNGGAWAEITSLHPRGFVASPAFPGAASSTVSSAADLQRSTSLATRGELLSGSDPPNAPRGAAPTTILPTPARTPRRSSQGVAGRCPQSAPPTAAAEDASWRADWELEWEAQVEKHTHWLLEPAAQPPSPLTLTSTPSQRGAGATAEGRRLLPAAMRTSAAVMLPGHAVAAAAAAATAATTGAPPAAGLNQHSPIPPMRTLKGRATQAAFPPLNRCSRGDMHKLRKGPPWSPLPLPAPPPLKQQKQAPTAMLAAPPAVNSRPDANCGPPFFLDGVAGGAGGPCVDGKHTALAAEVLLRIVCDAVVVQPEAWTIEEVAVLLRHAAKLAYRYPGLLTAHPNRQRHKQYQPPMAATAAALMPSTPSNKRNSAVSSLLAQSVGVHQNRTALDAETGMDAGKLNSGGSVGAAELRVRLQQLLLRVDGMLMPPRQEHHPGALQPAERRITSQPTVGTADTAAPAGGSGVTTDVARAEMTTASAAAAALGAVSVSLSASAAVWAVWTAAALQLRLSPEGNVRRRLLEEFRPRWRLLLQPKPRRRCAPRPVSLHGKREHQQPQSQPRVEGGGGVAEQELQHQQRPWELRRLERLDLQKPAVGSVRSRLDASDVADVLWGFAVLGLQMPRYHLDRALRAVSESNPRRLVLRPTRSPIARLGVGGTSAAATAAAAAVALTAAASGATIGGPPGSRAATATADAAIYLLAAKQADALTAHSPTSASFSCDTSSSVASTALADVRASGDGDVGGSGGGGASTGRVMPAGGGGYLARGLARLRPSQLTAVAWAAVELGEVVGQEGVTAVWAAQLFAATQTRLSRLSPSQLVDLLWSIGRGRRRPTGPWRRAMAAALLAAAAQLVPWQAARAAAAHAKLRIPVPYTVAAALLTTLHRNLATAQPSDVAAMVWALPYITHPYTELFVRRHRRLLLDCAISTQPTLPSLEPAQLVQLADGFAKLRQLPGVEWMRLHRETSIRLKSRFSEPNRRKIRQAYATMLSL